MAVNPQFAFTVKTTRVQCTAAYTDRSGGTAGLVDLITGGTNGTKVTQIVAKAAGANVIGFLLIFITDSSGANPRLFDELGFASAITPSATTQSARNAVLYDDLQLEPGQKIQVGFTALAAGPIPVNVIASAGDF